jgi:GMP synthase-like glutamine amidotransferase
VNYEVSSSVDELKKIMDKYDIVGAFSTGSDFNISKGEKSQVAEFAHKNLQCPILGICYGLHAMVDFYGGEIKDSGKLQQDHFKLTTFSEKHPLFKDIEMQDLEFSFDFKDIISKMPSGFKQMCMLDSIICGISDSQRKRFAVLFHPEDVETSYPFLDNFRILCSGEDESKEQEKLMQGQFEHLISFKNFVK